MQWINRNYSSLIKQAATTFPAVAVIGPRQAGKTELLKHLFPKAIYHTLDYPQMATEAEENPQLFLSRLSGQTIIDEVQYAPSLFRYLKLEIDRNRQPGQFILTGSQNFQLFEGVSESLSGRCAIINIQTLSVRELDQAGGDRNSLEILLFGGFPELWANPNVNRELWYSSYISTYIERDIRNILRVQNLRDFSRFMRTVALRTGQILSYTSIANDVGVAVSTIREWISALLASNQVFLLEPYFRNVGKRLVKSPKIYLADSGMACFLCGIRTMDQFMISPLRGHLWETFIFGQLFRSFMIRADSPPIYFWRTSSGSEVDCVIEEGGKYRLIEIKFHENPGKKDTKGFAAFAKDYGDKNVISETIFCRTPLSYSISKLCKAINVHEIS